MATDQQFCLRWNNHQSTLISVFDSLLENGTLVDCTLAAEGQYLKAHKVVLSACSPYLETLLSQHYEKHPIVILKDVKFTELKSMMDYMYRGEVNISQDQLGTFLKAAESLQIKGLTDNGDDAAAGSTTTKRQDVSSRPSVTEVRNTESKRPAPPADFSDASREGSISPSSLRKRRRTRRTSQGDDPDSHLDTTSNVCDFPINPSQTTPLSVPSSTVVSTPVQNIPKQIVKQEPISRIENNLNSTIAPESGLLKEKIEPPSEPLLEPKTEYLDYMNNENSIEVEDLTLDDDEDLDSSMDASRPGPSHGDMSNQGYQWPMSDQSGTDDIFMAAQQAVGAATAQQRDSQGMAAFFDFTDVQSSHQLLQNGQQTSEPWQIIDQSHAESDKYIFVKTKKSYFNMYEKYPSTVVRALCLVCNKVQCIDAIFYHRMYFCGTEPPKNLGFKLLGDYGTTSYCFKCKKKKQTRSIVLHAKYTCGKKSVKCLFCTRVYFINNRATKGPSRLNIINHMRQEHGQCWQTVDCILLSLSDETLTAIEKENFSIPITQPENIGISILENESSEWPNQTSSDPKKYNEFDSSENEPVVKNRLFTVRNLKLYKKKKPIIVCTICSATVRVDNVLFHKKAVCGRTPEEAECKMVKDNYQCLRCNSIVSSDHIEFHLKYVCGKQQITVQCFYCPKLFNNYTKLMKHLPATHNRVHHRSDLLSILPEADNVDSEHNIDGSNTSNFQNSKFKVVKHCFSRNTLPTELLKTSDKCNESPENESSLSIIPAFDSGPQQLIKCFYCKEHFHFVYEVLGHMEEDHERIHNTYEVLKEIFANQIC